MQCGGTGLQADRSAGESTPQAKQNQKNATSAQQPSAANCTEAKTSSACLSADDGGIGRLAVCWLFVMQNQHGWSCRYLGSGEAGGGRRGVNGFAPFIKGGHGGFAFAFAVFFKSKKQIPLKRFLTAEWRVIPLFRF